MQTVRLSIPNNALTQYDNFNVVSLCQFNGKILGAGPDGLFRLSCEDDDNGADIEAYIKTFALKLDHEAEKRVRFIYLNIETDGDVIVTPIVDGAIKESITFSPRGAGRQFIKKSVARTSRGVYWQFKIENVGGCWFSLDNIEVLTVPLSRGR